MTAVSHAVVIGASMSGLVAARVLSARFDRVTIIDRDSLPDAPENRRGVPQGHHGHGLLASGFATLKELFPRLERDLLADGAVPGDIIGNVRWFQHGYYKAKFASGFNGLLLSRPLLESTLRRHVRDLPNVIVIDKAHVLDLTTDKSRMRVTGIRLQRNRRISTMDATLVIDASGRASRSADWLEAVGYQRPETQAVAVNLGYTTRTFKRRPHDLNGDLAAILAPKPPEQTRVGFALAIEGERWMVTLGGWSGDHAPTDPQGYLDFARTLSRPDIYDIIKDAEPLTDAVTYVFPSNLRRLYHRLRRFPERYLVIGDALCSFNPFYGQGMSVAALEGFALGECLERHPSLERLWRPFFRSTARIIDTPWTIAAGSDFAFRGITGAKPVGADLINGYLNYVHRAASTDRAVCRAFFDVANLLKPATTLFAPSVLTRVARACFAGPLTPPGAAAPMARGTEPFVRSL